MKKKYKKIETPTGIVFSLFLGIIIMNKTRSLNKSVNFPKTYKF